MSEALLEQLPNNIVRPLFQKFLSFDDIIELMKVNKGSFRYFSTYLSSKQVNFTENSLSKLAELLQRL
jgi:hypothetical protein